MIQLLDTDRGGEDVEDAGGKQEEDEAADRLCQEEVRSELPRVFPPEEAELGDTKEGHEDRDVVRDTSDQSLPQTARVALHKKPLLQRLVSEHRIIVPGGDGIVHPDRLTCLGRRHQQLIHRPRSLPHHHGRHCGGASPAVPRALLDLYEVRRHRSLPLHVHLRPPHRPHAGSPLANAQLGLKLLCAQDPIPLRVVAHARAGVDGIPEQAVEPSLSSYYRSCQRSAGDPDLSP
eukprot:756852-Hanusia_phi.AAC.3